MPQDDWSRTKELFGEAVNLPPQERAAFLDHACGDDLKLRRAVENLIGADADSGSFLEQPALAGAPRHLGPGSSGPRRIGRYDIVRVISCGGMGIVYEAVQEKPRRSVAVKMMKDGFATEEALRRFEYECQVLARLKHPGIAQVIDAGTHPPLEEGGAPYLVMEYVPDARPITDYARDTKLSLAGRIELFLQVCEAVHHGHQKGVIHRDLKPSNILVDGQGQAKVIDFGVARAARGDAGGTVVLTEVGQLIGTLQYMSPEQCRGDPYDLDFRCDVYALGVVLYELLCGKLPYDVPTTDIFQAVRIIQDVTPPRPSTVRRFLRGDLETILLKALEKDRQHRYQTAADLAEDLRHHLRGEVILARPVSPPTRLIKWVKRNPVLSSASCVSLLSVASLVFYVLFWYGPRIQAERDIAEEVNRFLTTMLASADPDQGNIDVKVVDILDDAAARLEESFADQPGVKGALHETLGNTYYRLGRLAEAEAQLRSAEEIHARLLGADAEQTLKNRYARAVVLGDLGRYTESEQLLADVLEGCRTSLGHEHVITLNVAVSLGAIYLNQRKLDEAAELIENALEVYVRTRGPEDPGTLTAKQRLANVLRESGRAAEAEALTAAVLEARRRTLGATHVQTLTSMSSLANQLMALGRYAEAEAIQRELWPLQSQVLGAEHPHTAITMSNLAITLTALGRYAEAESLARSVMEIYERTGGMDREDCLLAESNLGIVLRNQGRLPEAEQALRHVADTRSQALGPDNPLTIGSLLDLATVLKRLRRYEEAESLTRTALAGNRAQFGDNHPRTLSAMSTLANLLGKLNRHAEAEALHRQTLVGRRAVLSDGNADTLASMHNLGNSLCAQGKYAEAEDLFRQAWVGQTGLRGEEHPYTCLALRELTECLIHQKKYAEAEERARTLLAIREKQYGAEHPDTHHAVRQLAQSLIGAEKLAAAEPLLLGLIESLTRRRGEAHSETQEAIRLLVELYDACGRTEDAASWRARLRSE